MLVNRGARINATNMGDDTALHLAAAHGHREITSYLLRHKADLNAVNEHGNTPLHYACFWGYQNIAEDLIKAGALVSLTNKFGETPLDKCKGQMAQKLLELADKMGQDVNKKVPYKDQSWLGTKTRSRDATLSRHLGIKFEELDLREKLAITPSGETWRGTWQGNEIAAKFISLGVNPSGDVIRRASRNFLEEFPRLRIFSHPNVLPVIGCTNSPPNLIVINQFMPFGSLYQVLHKPTNLVVDQARALQFAVDIAKGMSFLHSLEPPIMRYFLNSKHVYVSITIYLCS